MDSKGRLGRRYAMTDVKDASNTRDKILLHATIMFAQKGYSSVSVRDIAEAVSIKAPSIYNHFESKAALWGAVMENTESLYLSYFDRLDEAISEADSFEEVLDCMFYEPRYVVNIFTYYSYSVVLAEQFRDEKAYHIYSDIFLKFSVEFLKRKFDECIEKDWAKSFDTKASATLFMQAVLAGITLRTHEHMGRKVPYAVSEMFEKLHSLLLYAGLGRHAPGVG